MKKVIITGAGGLVATELIHLLTNSGYGYQIFAVSTHPEVIKERYSQNRNIICLNITELERNYSGNSFDVLIHCAFARSFEASEIAKSLQYTSKVLEIAKAFQIKTYINISSQSVYGKKNPPLWTEDTPPSPDYLYAMGKYATEILTQSALKNSQCKYTNIRLSSVCEKARFLNVFAKNAVAGNPITVVGGSQKFSFIDIRDVALAMKEVIDKAFFTELEPVYNLGNGQMRSLLSLAESTKQIAERKLNQPVFIKMEESEAGPDAGMDPSLFCRAFGWSPKYGYDDMIESLINLNVLGEKEDASLPFSFSLLY